MMTTMEFTHEASRDAGHWCRWTVAATLWLAAGAAFALPPPPGPGVDGWTPARAALAQMRHDLDAGRFDEALSMAAGLSLEGETPALRSEAQQMIGYAYARSGNYRLARDHYAAALEEDVVPNPARRAKLHYAVAQFCFALGEFDTALEHLVAWRDAGAGEPDGSAPLILLGQTYFKVGDYAAAIDALQAGLARAEARGETVPEHWLLLLHHLYTERQQWQDAAGVLERLNHAFPDGRYEQQLGEARARQSG